MVNDFAPTAPMGASPPPPAVIDGEDQEHDRSEVALVTDWFSKVDAAEEHWKEPFKQIKDNQDFAAKGADKKWIKDKCFRVPILNRHINQAVSTLYARNPTAKATRRKQLLYTLWDGRSDSLQAAVEGAVMGDPQSIAIVQEVLAALKQDLMLDRMAKTLEITWEYFLNEQSTNYKMQIKAAVRRTKVCGVSYIKLVFQRALKQMPEITAKIDDTTSKLNEVQRLLREQEAGEIGVEDAEALKLQTLLEDLKQQEYIIVREGPVLDFPKADQVLIDPDVIHLASLAGAHWIAFPYDKTVEEIEKTYGVKLGSNFSEFVESDSGTRKAPISSKNGQAAAKSKKVRIYEIWDKDSEQKMTICRGYPSFLELPAAPKPQLSRFWPLFPIVFNEVEHDDYVIPPSDIEQAKDIQNEYNRSREGLRQHRIASRPYYVEGGRLSESDRQKLGNHLDHEVLTLNALAAGEDINKLIMRGPTAPIDPNLYEVEIHFKDLLRVVGSQESNLGGTAGGTATESSIAESSRSTSTSDNIDDLDEVLTALFVAGGEMLLMEMTKESIVEIVGPGAVWPDHPQTRAEAAKHLMLDSEAGSSGRPNQAAELAKFERATPFLIQVPGLNPAPIAKRYFELLDLPVEEMTAEGMPSITALNAMMAKQAMAAGQPGTGDPMSDPAAQGPAGGDPMAEPPPNQGSAASFPTPTPV